MAGRKGRARGGFPEGPDFPDFPEFPEFPEVPDLPALPDLPAFSPSPTLNERVFGLGEGEGDVAVDDGE